MLIYTIVNFLKLIKCIVSISRYDQITHLSICIKKTNTLDKISDVQILDLNQM